MNVDPPNDNLICRHDYIGAYLDAELEQPVVQEFEAHLKKCKSCATELREQQHLLCTLNAAFGNGFELPDGFARIVQRRAENDLNGVRQKRERGRALLVALALGVASAALLGGAWNGSVLQPIRSLARVSLSLLEFTWQTVSDAATGLAVIGRLSAQAIIFSPYRPGLLSLLIFLLAVALLPRLITHYHRAQPIE